jgi:hypothetical protein
MAIYAYQEDNMKIARWILIASSMFVSWSAFADQTRCKAWILNDGIGTELRTGKMNPKNSLELKELTDVTPGQPTLSGTIGNAQINVFLKPDASTGLTGIKISGRLDNKEVLFTAGTISVTDTIVTSVRMSATTALMVFCGGPAFFD